jgi:hypothetical protein
MCKKCEDKQNRNKSYKKHNHNHSHSFGIVQNPNYSVEIKDRHFFDSTLEIRDLYQKSIDLYNILIN